MIEPRQPDDEYERMQTLCGLHLLDTPDEERFDRITATAQRMFQVPIALITLVDRERQWFKSRQGIHVVQTPRGVSFCGHAILREGPFIVADASLDERFADNPLVTGAPFIRFYAGMPLHADNGQRLGTLCLIDRVPRQFSAADAAALKDLAAWAELEINLLSVQRANEVSREKESRLRAIVDNVGDAIIAIDNAGLIDTFNPAAARIFGYSAAEVLGQPVELLAAPRFRAQVAHYVRGLAEDGAIDAGRVSRQVFARRKDGTRFPADLVVSEMRVHGWRAFTGLVRDISQRRRTAGTVKKLNSKLAHALSLQRAIVNSTNHAIIAVNAQGKVTMYNDGAQRMLGYSAAEMCTQEALARLHDPAELALRVQVLSEELGRPIRPGAEIFIAKARLRLPDESQWTYICKDGRRIPVMLSITAVWDEHEQLAGFVGIAHDLSEQKKIEVMKNEFISTLSHELRTPLTSIRGALGLLVGGAAGEIAGPAMGLLEMANKNCERLVRLISDILDVEKIESGNMRFEPVVQALLPLLEHAVAATHNYAAQFQVSFDLRSDAGDLMVAADTDRLLQVMANLLSNASKFSPAGEVVEIRLKRLPGLARVSVIDRGPGVPTAFRERIFQKFAQADGSDTRQKGGTGLGLNISRAIIEKHHGRIDLRTDLASGTEFFFELPLAPDPRQAP